MVRILDVIKFYKLHFGPNLAAALEIVGATIVNNRKISTFPKTLFFYLSLTQGDAKMLKCNHDGSTDTLRSSFILSQLY